MKVDNNSLTFKACTLCSGTSLKVLKKYSKDHLVKCNECSFVFAIKIPSSNELDLVYSNYSRGNQITSLSKTKNINLAQFIKDINPEMQSCLDIACGEGHLLEAFNEIGIQTFGTEHESGKDLLIQKGINYIEGEFFPKTDNKFDLIIFTEAIEHINDQEDFIKHAKSLLNPNGLLYMTTPNFNSLERRVLGPSWGMFVYPEHLSYYSPKTINILHTQEGLEKVFVKTENISIYRFIEYFKRNQVKESSNANNFDPLEVSDKVQRLIEAKPIFSILKKIVNYFLNLLGLGTSLISLYKKK